MKFGKQMEGEIADLEDLQTTTTVRDLLPFVKYKHLKKVIKGKDQSCLTNSSVASASMECPLGADGPLTTEPNDRFFTELDSAVEELDSFFTRLTLNLTPFMPASTDGDGPAAHANASQPATPNHKRFKFDIDAHNAQLDEQDRKSMGRNMFNAAANMGGPSNGSAGAVVVHHATVKTQHDTTKDEAATTAVLLLRWSQINTTALRKITKKRDKNFGDGSGARWLVSRGQFLRFLYSPIIEKLGYLARHGVSERSWTLTPDPQSWLLASRALNTPVQPFLESVGNKRTRDADLADSAAFLRTTTVVGPKAKEPVSRASRDDGQGRDCRRRQRLEEGQGYGPEGPQEHGLAEEPGKSERQKRRPASQTHPRALSPPTHGNSATHATSSEMERRSSALLRRSSSAHALYSLGSAMPSMFSGAVPEMVLAAAEAIKGGERDKVFVRGFGKLTLDGGAGYSLAGSLMSGAFTNHAGGGDGGGDATATAANGAKQGEAQGQRVRTVAGVQHLGFVGCRITDAGAWALAAGLRFCKTLRVLDFSSCALSDVGAATIMNALTNTNIEKVYITQCGVTDETARMIAERLKVDGYRSLRAVCLDNNEISSRSLPHLAEGMRINRANGGRLTSIDLRGAGGVEEQHVVNEASGIWLGGLLMP